MRKLAHLAASHMISSLATAIYLLNFMKEIAIKIVSTNPGNRLQDMKRMKSCERKENPHIHFYIELSYWLRALRFPSNGDLPCNTFQFFLLILDESVLCFVFSHLFRFISSPIWCMDIKQQQQTAMNTYEKYYAINQFFVCSALTISVVVLAQIFFGSYRNNNSNNKTTTDIEREKEKNVHR